jgi:hypothetical protein
VYAFTPLSQASGAIEPACHAAKEGRVVKEGRKEGRKEEMKEGRKEGRT